LRDGSVRIQKTVAEQHTRKQAGDRLAGREQDMAALQREVRRMKIRDETTGSHHGDGVGRSLLQDLRNRAAFSIDHQQMLRQRIGTDHGFFSKTLCGSNTRCRDDFVDMAKGPDIPRRFTPVVVPDTVAAKAVVAFKT